MNAQLFDIPKKKLDICGKCEHLIRCEYTSIAIFYCKIRKSSSTANGLLKIKYRSVACSLFKKK